MVKVAIMKEQVNRGALVLVDGRSTTRVVTL